MTMPITTSFDSDLFFELSGSGNLVRLEPIAYELPLGDHYWVKTKIIVKGGVFTGQYIASITTDDYEFLKKGLTPLYDNLKGGVLFNDLENAIELKIQGDGIGHFTVNVTARDNPGPNFNKLKFTIIFDQTEIKKLVAQLDRITIQFQSGQ